MMPISLVHQTSYNNYTITAWQQTVKIFGCNLAWGEHHAFC